MKKIFILLLLLINILGIVLSIKTSSHNLEMYFLDVGQGDSVLVKSPDDKYILVDGGPDNAVLAEIGKVMPPWNRRIDAVIASHNDTDHIGGLAEILKRYDVGRIYIEEEQNSDNEYYQEIMKTIEDKKIYHSSLNSEKDLQIGCCTFIDVVWPTSSVDRSKLDANEKSIVFNLKYEGFDAFFGGDIPSKYEDLIAKNDGVDVDLLKVSHHGSKSSTSDELLDLIDPEIAVISVGEKNRYKHPSQDVLDRLMRHDVITFRTDKYGTIKIISDGEKVSF